jgi:hypothetical protein
VFWGCLVVHSYVLICSLADAERKKQSKKISKFFSGKQLCSSVAKEEFYLRHVWVRQMRVKIATTILVPKMQPINFHRK